MNCILRTMLIVAGVFALSACTPGASAPPQPLSSGTKIKVKSGGEIYYSTITKRDGPVVLMDATNWKNEIIYQSRYYRGLLLIGRIEDGYDWSLDVDLSPLEDFFPLEVGAVAKLAGSVVNVDGKKTDSYKARLEVKTKKPFLLSSGNQTVYEIEITQSFSWDDGTKKWTQTVYYAPELGINLKGVFTRKGEPEYWRVTDIKRPNEATAPTPVRQRRRSGTVMI